MPYLLSFTEQHEGAWVVTAKLAEGSFSSCRACPRVAALSVLCGGGQQRILIPQYVSVIQLLINPPDSRVSTNLNQSLGSHLNFAEV